MSGPRAGEPFRPGLAHITGPMNDFLSVVLFVGVWFALQTWILPRLGVPT